MVRAAITRVQKLEKRSLKREKPDEHVPPVRPLLANLAEMWRKAKRTRDYVGAKQALSLLLLPSDDRTTKWTRADIIALVSDVKPIVIGDSVLVSCRGRNTRGVGVVTARHEDGDGNITFTIGPVDVPPRSRRSVGTMTHVAARDVEHVESLICRPGEASTNEKWGMFSSLPNLGVLPRIMI